MLDEDITTFAQSTWDWLAGLGPRLIGGIAILVVGFLLARYISRGVARLMQRSGRLEPTVTPIVRAIIRYAIGIVTIIAGLAQLGVQTASVLAVLGAAGLAVGLALQGTLTNIAAGLMLLWLRPFRVGDAIETATVAGTVEEIGLFASRLRGVDGVFKFVPNSELWAKTISNYSKNPNRMVSVDFIIRYDSDLARARAVLTDVAIQHPKVLRVPPVEAVPTQVTAANAVVQLHAWVRSGDYAAVRWDLTEGGKRALDGAGLTTAAFKG
ncbi:MAG: mechanosensitive ion channel [Bauldia sp.]|nr:mechanosensitive ion channel [Bauldia sp.]